MRTRVRLAWATVLAAAVVGCARHAPVAGPRTPEELARAIVEAVNDRDRPRYLALHHPASTNRPSPLHARFADYVMDASIMRREIPEGFRVEVTPLTNAVLPQSKTLTWPVPPTHTMLIFYARKDSPREGCFTHFILNQHGRWYIAGALPRDDALKDWENGMKIIEASQPPSRHDTAPGAGPRDRGRHQE